MRVYITVRPSSRTEKVEEQEDGSLLIGVRAPAKGGEANRAVIRLLSRHFKKDVRIVSGLTSHRKMVEVT
jgi:hypothetical protein